VISESFSVTYRKGNRMTENSNDDDDRSSGTDTIISIAFTLGGQILAANSMMLRNNKITSARHVIVQYR